MSELYPGSYQIPPMRYGITPAQSKVDVAMSSPDWYIQEKRDGAFYQLEHSAEDNVYLFGRTLSKITGEYTEKIDNVPWLREWVKEYLPKESILLGEIYIYGGHSNDVTKIMGCLPEKAIERQKEIKVHYMIFDCLRLNGEDLTTYGFEKRIEKLQNLLNELSSIEDVFSQVHFIPAFSGKDCDFASYLSEIFERGGEGAVLKHKDCPYRPGMRTTALQAFKMKEHIDSIDLVVIELLEPEKVYSGKELDNWPYWEEDTPVTKPYYYGWKNALKLGAYNDEGKLIEVGRVASGLTDEIRANLAASPDNYLGRVCELSCMSLNKKDLTMRHPVFIRFRDDKDAAECKIDEIF